MTSHRAEAAGLMAKTAACPDASEHLLAAIHDLLAERLPMPLVTRESDPGPEPAPRALICTEAEDEAHCEVRRRVITTYQIEDDPSALRGIDGADMTPSALAWLERFVTNADPDVHPAYAGKPEPAELAPLIRAREAAAWDAGAEAAWDAGLDAGYQYARAVNPEWPDMPTNPFEGADDARD